MYSQENLVNIFQDMEERNWTCWCGVERFLV